MVWTSQAGRYEGSRIRNNIIEDIHNISGGDGPYGNGVSIWGSGSVRVENNKIYRCAYTAVRNNAGRDILVIGNDCKGFGEKAMYAEFGAKRATFRDNKIVDAGGGDSARQRGRPARTSASSPATPSPICAKAIPTANSARKCSG